jgi:hypothetical protein
MPYRVQNKKTGHVYTVGIVSDDENDITSDGAPATVSGGNEFRPAVYGDEASAEVAASKKKGQAS